ncbi:hypothetical protein Mame01_49750 [Microbispora amethystogenes]|nr:hypothetical protein Mame01_49750 [Microbispora amethystogenes]
MHHAAQRAAGGDGVQHLRQGVPVGDVAGHQGDLRAGLAQVAGEGLRAGGVRPGSAHEQQVGRVSRRRQPAGH